MDGSHAYRLKQWPQIPDRFRTARVLGACSRMTVGPVTSNWFLTHTGLEPAAAAELVASLVAQGALECISLGRRSSSQADETHAPATAGAKLRERLVQRFAWKRAAVTALLCLGVSAALDDRFPGDLGTLALPNLPASAG
ncbi:MAG TPA: hypothetical protein VFM98_14575 [Ramlibacter sp.]|nr:hypothetical protein [Ramlibacter sp.]